MSAIIFFCFAMLFLSDCQGQLPENSGAALNKPVALLSYINGETQRFYIGTAFPVVIIHSAIAKARQQDWVRDHDDVALPPWKAELRDLFMFQDVLYAFTSRGVFVKRANVEADFHSAPYLEKGIFIPWHEKKYVIAQKDGLSASNNNLLKVSVGNVAEPYYVQFCSESLAVINIFHDKKFVWLCSKYTDSERASLGSLNFDGSRFINPQQQVISALTTPFSKVVCSYISKGAMVYMASRGGGAVSSLIESNGQAPQHYVRLTAETKEAVPWTNLQEATLFFFLDPLTQKEIRIATRLYLFQTNGRKVRVIYPETSNSRDYIMMDSTKFEENEVITCITQGLSPRGPLFYLGTSRGNVWEVECAYDNTLSVKKKLDKKEWSNKPSTSAIAGESFEISKLKYYRVKQKAYLLAMNSYGELKTISGEYGYVVDSQTNLIFQDYTVRRKNGELFPTQHSNSMPFLGIGWSVVLELIFKTVFDTGPTNQGCVYNTKYNYKRPKSSCCELRFWRESECTNTYRRGKFYEALQNAKVGTGPVSEGRWPPFSEIKLILDLNYVAVLEVSIKTNKDFARRQDLMVIYGYEISSLEKDGSYLKPRLKVYYPGDCTCKRTSLLWPYGNKYYNYGGGWFHNSVSLEMLAYYPITWRKFIGENLKRYQMDPLDISPKKEAEDLLYHQLYLQKVKSIQEEVERFGKRRCYREEYYTFLFFLSYRAPITPL